jgi:hypothetical protein
MLLVWFAVIGFIVACDAMRTLYPRFISGKWIKVTASVAYAGAQCHDDGGYTAWLVYDYVYVGKKYRSPMTHVDWPIRNQQDAEAFEKMWNRSRSRDVWVNEKSPNVSLVSLDKWMLSAVVFSVGLLTTTVSLFFVIKDLAG